MIVLHLVLGLTFMVAAAALAVWAYVRYRRRQDLPVPFWHALRALAAVVAVQVLLGLLLLAHGRHPSDKLHLMYAGLVVLGVAIAELLRPRSSLGRMLREEGHFSESGAYAVLTAVVSLLTLRLWMTG